MVRSGFSQTLCAGVVLALTAAGARGEDAEARLRTQLAVQAALQQGRESIQRGDYQTAVYVLEKEITRVDGSREYMNALREAYRGYIRDLQQRNLYAEARTYQERLKILDPGYHLELAADRPATPTVASLAAQAPRGETTVARPAAPYTPRSAMPDEQDVFADSNRAPVEPAARAAAAPTGGLVDRARREYDAKNYAAADRLFEQANKTDGRSVESYRELWAFCKLHGVTEKVNRAGWAPPAEAEKEILAALALTSSPELERHGKQMLRSIQDRRVEVRHVPAQAGKWAVAETANFSVIHNQSRELAEQVARVAETTRAAVTRKWFGEEPAAWSRKCRIILYATAEAYARDTQKDAGSPGHSTMQVDRDNFERVVDRRIDLHCDVPEMLTDVLPHETTHTVLAGRFGRHHLPRWADEGMALLSEPPEKVARYLKNLEGQRGRHELFGAARLMAMDDYPERRLVTPFYVQSISLVSFLSAQKGGPQEFTRFLRDALDGGYEAALRKHYDIRDYRELDERWTRGASDGGRDTAALYRPGG